MSVHNFYFTYVIICSKTIFVNVVNPLYISECHWKNIQPSKPRQRDEALKTAPMCYGAPSTLYEKQKTKYAICGVKFNRVNPIRTGCIRFSIWTAGKRWGGELVCKFARRAYLLSFKGIVHQFWIYNIFCVLMKKRFLMIDHLEKITPNRDTGCFFNLVNFETWITLSFLAIPGIWK